MFCRRFVVFTKNDGRRKPTNASQSRWQATRSELRVLPKNVCPFSLLPFSLSILLSSESPGPASPPPPTPAPLVPIGQPPAAALRAPPQLAASEGLRNISPPEMSVRILLQGKGRWPPGRTIYPRHCSGRCVAGSGCRSCMMSCRHWIGNGWRFTFLA